MRFQMIISGVGGQGVLFATRIFSTMALTAGYPLIGSETHGMSQRGGSVITHLKIGEFASPLVRRGGADILLALERNEAYRALPYLRQGTATEQGGLCFINAPNSDYLDRRVRACLKENRIETYIFGADRMAEQMGSARSANIALIGFACAYPRLPLSPGRIREAIEKTTPSEFTDVSLRIFDHGLLEGRRTLTS